MKLCLSFFCALLLSTFCVAEEKKKEGARSELSFTQITAHNYDTATLFDKLNAPQDELDLEVGRDLMYKGKGKGKGSKGSKGKGMMGKGMMGKGSKGSKGKGSKGKGMSSKGKGSKGKGSSSKGKGSKGKGSSSKGKGSSYKGKGKGAPAKGKGKGAPAKGKGKGAPAKGKGKGKGKGAPEPKEPTLKDIVVETKSLSTLEYALKTAGLLDVFAEPDLGVSVLAPDDAAFAKLADYDKVFYEAVLTKPWILHLQFLLLNHVITAVKAADVVDGALYETLAPGSTVGAVVTDMSTCFVPALAEEGGCVVVADVMAKNGIAHIIDSVLLPYYVFYPVASLAVEFQEDAGLTKLVELVVCAGLDGALDSTFGITVFAPTDDAFMGIDKDYLCGDGIDELTAILTYHVVPQVVPSVHIYSGKQYLPTLYGKPVSVQKKGDDVMVNDAFVIVPDFLAYNGIVHVIDKVLMPPEAPPAKGKGKGKGAPPAKGKGKGAPPAKGKGKGAPPAKGKGKGAPPAKGKGKGAPPAKGKGKGKGSSSKGKGMSYKGKGKGSKGKGSSGKGSKGKGSKGSKGKGSKGKGGMMGMMGGMMGKGSKGKGSKGKGY